MTQLTPSEVEMIEREAEEQFENVGDLVRTLEKRNAYKVAATKYLLQLKDELEMIRAEFEAWEHKLWTDRTYIAINLRKTNADALRLELMDIGYVRREELEAAKATIDSYYKLNQTISEDLRTAKAEIDRLKGLVVLSG